MSEANPPYPTLCSLRHAGLTVRLGDGAKLLVSPASLLTPELRQAITDYRALLLDELEGEQRAEQAARQAEEAREDAYQVKMSERLFRRIPFPTAPRYRPEGACWSKCPLPLSEWSEKKAEKLLADVISLAAKTIEPPGVSQDVVKVVDHYIQIAEGYFRNHAAEMRRGWDVMELLRGVLVSIERIREGNR